MGYLYGYGTIATLGAATETLVPGATITVPARKRAVIRRVDGFAVGATATDRTQLRLRQTNLLGAVIWQMARVDAGPLGGETFIYIDNGANAAALVIVMTAEQTAGLATDHAGGSISAVYTP